VKLEANKVEAKARQPQIEVLRLWSGFEAVLLIKVAISKYL
jgi:hypothetical protein